MYSILFSLASQVTFHRLYGQSIVHLFSHAAALESDDIVGKSRHLFINPAAVVSVLYEGRWF